MSSKLMLQNVKFSTYFLVPKNMTIYLSLH